MTITRAHRLRRGLPGLLLVGVLTGATATACGNDDGGTVRNIGNEDTGSGVEGSGSGVEGSGSGVEGSGSGTEETGSSSEPAGTGTSSTEG